MIRRSVYLSVAFAGFFQPISIQAQEIVVYQVAITGSFNRTTAQVVRRAITAAQVRGAAAVVLDIDTPGGPIDVAQEIVGDISGSDVPVYAFVSGHAWQTGALVALAADSIFLGPGSSIGAGTETTGAPSRHSDTALRVLGDALAQLLEERGIDRRIGEAMVDEDIAIHGVVERGTLLTLAGKQALDLGIAAALADDMGDMLEKLDLDQAVLRTVAEDWTAATVRVQNNNWHDIKLYVVRSGGSRMRLGTITSMASRSYTLPQRMVAFGSDIRIVAELIGSSSRHSTHLVRVEPGLVIEWTIENVLNNSTIFVWVHS